MTFQEAISDFINLSMNDVQELIREEDSITLFFGRATCSFCRLFAPKLARVAKDTGTKVYFIDTDNTADYQEIQTFRNHFHINTVPGLFVKRGNELNVVCNSRLSVEKLNELLV